MAIRSFVRWSATVIVAVQTFSSASMAKATAGDRPRPGVQAAEPSPTPADLAYIS